MDSEMMHMDDELNAALEPITRDLRAAGYEFQFRDEPGWGGPDPAVEVIVGRERIGGLYLPYTTSEAERIVTLAGQVQDMIVEFVMPDGKAVAWPACKIGHAHPMKEAYGEGDDPIWVCPADSGYQVPIGSWQPPSEQ